MARAASASLEISRGRKLVAGAAMVVAAGLVAREGLEHFAVDWLLVLSAGVLGVAGVGITRRSLVTQVLSRGAAWVVLLPALIISFFSVVNGHTLSPEIPVLALSTGAALLLARPMLHTREAFEQFAPKAFRRWLLSGSIATAGTACVAGAVALGGAMHGRGALAVGFGTLAASLLASTIAVVRMRSWGIFLGALTSLILLMSGWFVSRDEGFVLALGAAPSLLMHLLPVLVARWRSGREGQMVRVSEPAVEPALTPARYRVATDEPDLELDATPPEHQRAAIRA